MKIERKDAIQAWWFSASDTLPHGDGRKIEVGKIHRLRGEIVLCEHALHASRHPSDALKYATGPYLHKVLCWGDVGEDCDKIGCSARLYVSRHDATDMLRLYARRQALSVIDNWQCPDVVRWWLETGDESLCLAARSAARSAAWSAARSAAWSAAYSAAWSVAESAAWSAAGSAAHSAAWSAAESAAWSAAYSAAHSAAYSAAHSAAYSAAHSAAYSAGSAARSAESAARDMFQQMAVELCGDF